LHKLRRTKLIEVNHGAKVANKSANINVKTAVYTPVNGVITHQNSKYQKGDIAQQNIDT